MKGKARSNPLYRLKDPYMVRYSDPTICPKCGVIYHNKRWFFDEEKKEYFNEKSTKKLCPACRKIKDRFPMGVVLIEAEYLKDKKEEIRNHIMNIEKKEKINNPLGRIMTIKNSGKNKWNIETTTEHLAMTIGRSVAKTFGGETKFSFSKDEKFIRVCVYNYNIKKEKEKEGK